MIAIEDAETLDKNRVIGIDGVQANVAAFLHKDSAIAGLDLDLAIFTRPPTSLKNPPCADIPAAASTQQRLWPRSVRLRVTGTWDIHVLAWPSPLKMQVLSYES